MSDQIYTEAQRKTIAASRPEAFDYLQEIQAANENLKDVVSALAEKTGLDKTQISGYYKASFKQVIKKASANAALFEFLDED